MFATLNLEKISSTDFQSSTLERKFQEAKRRRSHSAIQPGLNRLELVQALNLNLNLN